MYKYANISIDELSEGTCLNDAWFTEPTGWIYICDWVQCIKNLSKITGYSIERLGHEIILNDFSTWQIAYLCLTPISFLCNKNLMEGISKVDKLVVRKEGNIVIATTTSIKGATPSIITRYNIGAIRAVLARKGYKNIQVRIMDNENTAYTWDRIDRFTEPEAYQSHGISFIAKDFEGVI